MPDRREFLQQSLGLAGALAFDPLVDVAQGYRPKAPIVLGLIGAGRQGREILGELAKFENVQVGAVCELEATRLARSVRRTKDAKGYEKWEEMLAKETGIAGYIVATPTAMHRPIVEKLLDAGKHVYCEAPLATSVEDARALAKAGTTAKTVFQVGHPGRANPVYGLARSFYRANSIETLLSARGQWRRKLSWREPVTDASQEKARNWRLYKATSLGLLGEEGSHQLDTMFWFTNKLPTSIHARGALLVHSDGREVADTVQAVLGFEGGMLMTWNGTLGNGFEGSSETFIGTMGAIRLADRFGWLFKEADAPIQGWEVYASRQQFHNEEGITLIADATKLASQGKLKDGIGLPHPPLYYSLESFVKSIAESSPPVCSAKDALPAVVVAAAAAESERTKTETTIDPALYQV